LKNEKNERLKNQNMNITTSVQKLRKKLEYFYITTATPKNGPIILKETKNNSKDISANDCHKLNTKSVTDS